MGWVTLTLRKRELKQEHAYYQLRDLQISREKRQLARSKSYKIAEAQNKQQQELQGPKTTYTTANQQYQDTMKGVYSGDSNSGDATGKQAKMNEAQSALSQAQLDYQSEVDRIKTYYENEKQMIEEEAADAETELDMEQVEVEAQMEAIAEEIQAVSDQISTEIKNSTIKLA